MQDCCEIAAELTDRQRRVLRIVLGINAAMFVAEATAGLVAHSTALPADSVEMLGDAIVYRASVPCRRGTTSSYRPLCERDVRRPASLSAGGASRFAVA